MTAVRIGTGLDIHAFVDPDAGPTGAADRTRPLVLCGVRLPDGPPLAGHSDADVGAHAVADALLGAAALGDLGERFGVDRPETAGADSMALLRTVVADVAAAGFEVGNVDLTLVAQRPRLAPHRDAMRANLAAALHLDVAAVSVKFTTTDRLGTIGRGEGIAGWCGALLLGVHR